MASSLFLVSKDCLINFRTQVIVLFGNLIFSKLTEKVVQQEKPKAGNTQYRERLFGTVISIIYEGKEKFAE